MRFLVDENIPAASIRELRAVGHDVLAIAESSPGSKDVDVLRAAREGRWILLTFDRDYGELIYRRGLPAPAGVVHLRFIPDDPVEVARVVGELAKAPALQMEGHYSVVGSDRIRQRPLP